MQSFELSYRSDLDCPRTAQQEVADLLALALLRLRTLDPMIEIGGRDAVSLAMPCEASVNANPALK
jgi:hypothetical protein